MEDKDYDIYDFSKDKKLIDKYGKISFDSSKSEEEQRSKRPSLKERLAKKRAAESKKELDKTNHQSHLNAMIQEY